MTGENMTASSEPTSDRPAFFDQLVATVEQLSATRSALRQIIALTDDAPALTNAQLRDRLLALAERARLVQHPLVLTVHDRRDVTLPARPRPPAGLSECASSTPRAPGGRPVPESTPRN
jgi:hypothetical protein